MEYKNFKNHTRTCTYKKNGYCNETRSGEAFEWKELAYGGKPLKPKTLLEEYNVQKNTTFHQLGRLKGGKKDY